MISFITPEDQFPLTDKCKEWAKKIAKLHAQFTEAKILEALEKRFGELPSAEDIAAHCVGVRDHEGTTHYIWVDKKPEVGEHIDLSNPLCVIAPPQFGGPMSL